jgi:hypothetical protein
MVDLLQPVAAPTATLSGLTRSAAMICARCSGDTRLCPGSLMFACFAIVRRDDLRALFRRQHFFSGKPSGKLDVRPFCYPGFE